MNKISGSINKNDVSMILQFILPGLIMLTLFIFLPIIRAVIMSFQQWSFSSGSGSAHPFVGLKNYKEFLGLTHLQVMGKATIGYTVFSVSGKMLLGLLVALLLNKRFFGKSVVRGIMLIPWAMPTVVVCNVFLIALNPSYGILSDAISKLPFIDGQFQVFNNMRGSFITVTLISIWKNFPFVSLMLLAALSGIPQDYYDAASIDGAGNFSQFLHITWPQIKPIYKTLLVLEILWTIKEFELIYLITRGGPNNATNVIGIDIYLNAFRYYKVGLACAESVLLLTLCLVFAVIYFRNQNKEGN